MGNHIRSEIWTEDLGWLPTDATCGGIGLQYSLPGYIIESGGVDHDGKWAMWAGWSSMMASKKDVEESRVLLGEDGCVSIAPATEVH